jgi:hypothetical protein
MIVPLCLIEPEWLIEPGCLDQDETASGNATGLHTRQYRERYALLLDQRTVSVLSDALQN